MSTAPARLDPSTVWLESLDLTRLDDVVALTADPNVRRFTRIPDPPPADFARGWIERYVTAAREGGSREGFAAVDGKGVFLGLALAPQIDRHQREIELGYIVAEHARGRGAATAMLDLLTRWAFEELEMQRAYLIIHVENVASQRVAERCGYVREGVMRSILLKADQRIDAGLWSRLPSDPPPGAAGPTGR
jgi:RimJ/RimL family protein N-acetyltransferase